MIGSVKSLSFIHLYCIAQGERLNSLIGVVTRLVLISYYKRKLEVTSEVVVYVD